ncbi:MAG: efflux RND transporter periplasmic adaptor subunit [Sedimentisphaerales bacterium]|nr:efflux RND transporter periplasmic adaptor subunit [Sedimentisphaerales bacterium]
MKKSRIIIIVILVVVVVVVSMGMVLKRKMKKSENTTTVRIENAQSGKLIEFVSAPGEIEPLSNVEISAKVSARVVALPYDEGDTVTKGDPNASPPVPPSVLVKLDSKDWESQLVSAQASRDAQAAQIEVEKARINSQEANLKGLTASLEQAQKDMERQKGLLQSKDIAQATYDQTKAKFDELKAQFESAQHTLTSAKLNLVVLQHNLEAADARIDQAKEALSYTTIVSPIDGTVTRLNAEVGEMVMTGTMNNAGTIIMVVGDLSEMLVVAQVDEADVGKLEVGQKARVHVQAWPEKIFNGKVTKVALSHKFSNQGTKYYEAEVLLIDPNEQVFTGMTADVDIAVAEHGEVLIVPSQAVLGRKVDELPVKIRDKLTEQEKKKAFASVVYVYKDGKAIATPVQIGASNTTQTVVESGLTAEDKIVVGPYKELESLKHEQSIKDEREVEAEKKAKGKDKTDANEPNDVNAVSDANDAPKKD